RRSACRTPRRAPGRRCGPWGRPTPGGARGSRSARSWVVSSGLERPRIAPDPHARGRLVAFRPARRRPRGASASRPRARRADARARGLRVPRRRTAARPGAVLEQAVGELDVDPARLLGEGVLVLDQRGELGGDPLGERALLDQARGALEVVELVLGGHGPGALE